ncbi:MAG4270 family putative restriction endonuclease [Spiroplasma endosymbiont of Aspidapion aeneum]|uniref:MAG4270 family putative restriction endonuclease n=1 Tax=Spiroplasma endosymbiont of Aspidapion aeneum TaxID=3066276 RepID=UPI00313EF926
MIFYKLDIPFASLAKLLKSYPKRGQHRYMYSGVYEFYLDQLGNVVYFDVTFDTDLLTVRYNDNDNMNINWKGVLGELFDLRSTVFNHIDKRNYKVPYGLSSDDIDNLNNLIKNRKVFNNVLKIDIFISGANTSTKINLHNTNPIFIYYSGINSNNPGNYNFCPFINFFYKISTKNMHDYYTYLFSKRENHKIIHIKNLEDYFSLFSEKKQLFEKFNKSNFPNLIDEDSSEEVIKSTMTIRDVKEIDNVYNDYCNSLGLYSKNLNTKIYSKNDTLNKYLRSIYNKRINNWDNFSNMSDNIFNIPDYMIADNAHIVSFSYLCKTKDYKRATDPENRLKLEPNIHRAFDDSIISIDNTGKVIFNENRKNEVKIFKGRYGDGLKIKKEIFNEFSNKTKNYINENFLHFKKNKKNL